MRNNKTLYPSKNIARRFLALVLLIMMLITPSANALSPEQKKIFDSGVYYYNAKVAQKGCSAGSGSTLVGKNNEEKVWNFFIGKGLSPTATAGIMGNFFQEDANFDPAEKQNKATHAIPDGGNGSTGFGIAQWTAQSRQAALFAKIKEAGLDKYYGEGWGNPEIDKEMPQGDNDALLLIELNFAWDSDPQTKIKDIANQLNVASSVEGENGSTLIFHRTFEGSGDNASQIQERVDSANDFLTKYNGTTNTSPSGCATQLGGVSKMEDAIPWAMKFVEDTKSKYHPAGHALDQKNNGDIINVYWTSDASVGASGCWGATYCGQCTALSGWFVTNMTGYTYGGGNGSEVVGNLKAKGVPTGTEPKPYSIFSWSDGGAGHTGVVLGVQSNGTVITIENNWPDGNLVVRQYNIKQKYPSVTFAYVGNKLKVNGLSTTTTN